MVSTLVVTIQPHHILSSGLLAEKAVQSQVPDDFPFATRVACEVTDSNGTDLKYKI